MARSNSFSESSPKRDQSADSTLQKGSSLPHLQESPMKSSLKRTSSFGSKRRLSFAARLADPEGLLESGASEAELSEEKLDEICHFLNNKPDASEKELKDKLALLEEHTKVLGAKMTELTKKVPNKYSEKNLQNLDIPSILQIKDFPDDLPELLQKQNAMTLPEGERVKQKLTQIHDNLVALEQDIRRTIVQIVRLPTSKLQLLSIFCLACCFLFFVFMDVQVSASPKTVAVSANLKHTSPPFAPTIVGTTDGSERLPLPFLVDCLLVYLLISLISFN